MHAEKNYDLEEKFVFSAKAKQVIFMVLAVGIVLFALGFFIRNNYVSHLGEASHHASVTDGTNAGTVLADVGEGHGDPHAGGHDAAHGGHHAPTIMTHLFATLWHNNIFFAGVALIGLFFVAFNYCAMAGWSSSVKRIAEAMGTMIPIFGILIIVSFFLVKGDIFHWTDASVYLKDGGNYDAILDGKKAWFFGPGSDGQGLPIFYIIRMVLFFAIWTLFFMLLRKKSLQEDEEGGTKIYRSMVKLSAGFLVFFAVSSSMAAWDWVMSIDPHWFSTMFGWYVFASWFVTGLATIAFTTVLLKDAGYLKIVNANHLHDLGKFVFAFSIFWTYIWFSQYLLIYYANIPEETVYYVDRLQNPEYALFFYLNIFINFFFPFISLMTRDAKRKMIILKVVCVAVIVGHWLDFYLMITPGVLKDQGGLGLLEIGLGLIYASLFAFGLASALSKHRLIAKNHPMLKESINHHI